MKPIKKIKCLLFLLTLVITCAGCGSNPAGAPSIPIEIPSILQFPKSLGVEVISPGGTTSANLSSKMIGLDGEYTMFVAQSVGFYEIFLDATDANLNIIGSVKIPVDTKTTSYIAENVETVDRIKSKIVYDFRDFDLNGDGKNEGCTGCTCPFGCSPAINKCPTEAPVADLGKVCFRVMVYGSDDMGGFLESKSAGYFDKFLPILDDPETTINEQNNGAGKILTMRGQGNLNKIDFNHRDPDHPLNQQTDFSILLGGRDEEGNLIGGTNAHAYVEKKEEQDLNGSTFIRTLLNIYYNPNINNDEEVGRMIGQYRDDRDFWSGTWSVPEWVSMPLGLDAEIPPTCIRLTTANSVLDDICLDLGIDVSDIVFVPPVDENEMKFPVDFPDDPTP